MVQRPADEGRIPFNFPNAGKVVSTWYKIIGDLGTPKPALVLLHGGPGAGHDYLSSLTDIYDKHQIPIVFYDQIGGARSTHFREKMGDEDFWTVDLFIQELDNLVDHLGLRTNGFFLLGQSWGGAFAGAYAARQPAGLKKVVIASGPSDMSLYVEGTRALLAKLPDEVKNTIEDCERRGDYDSPEYEAALVVWAQRHVCRLDPWPQPLQDTFSNFEDDPTAYLSTQGPSDFRLAGSLRKWEGWSKAHLIDVPVLLTNGRLDSVQDVSIKPWFDHISNVKWVRFEQSSHMPHWEERERYMKIVGDFLTD